MGARLLFRVLSVCSVVDLFSASKFRTKSTTDRTESTEKKLDEAISWYKSRFFRFKIGFSAFSIRLKPCFMHLTLKANGNS